MSRLPASPNPGRLSFYLLPFAFLLFSAPLLPTPGFLFPAVAQTTQDRKAEAERLLQSGRGLIEKGQFKVALEQLQQALQLYQQMQDRNGAATTLNELGKVYDGLSDYARMGEAYQTALKLARAISNRTEEGNALNGVGDIHFYKSEYAKAQEPYQQALAIFKATGNRKGEAQSLNNIGNLHIAQAQYSKALDFYQKALAIWKEIGDLYSESGTLNNIGVVYRELNQYVKSLEFSQQALELFKQIGSRYGEGQSLNTIGAIYSSLGQYIKALESYKQALEIAREIGIWSGEGHILNIIGETYSRLGQNSKALDFYQEALAISEELEDQIEKGRILNNIGESYWLLGQYAKALNSYEKALAIYKALSERLGEGTALNGIGAIYYSLGDYSKALSFYQKSLAIREEINDRGGQGTTISNIGNAYHGLEEYSRALQYFQKALMIHKEVGNRLMEGTTLDNIGSVYGNLRKYSKTVEFCQQALLIRKEIGDLFGEGTTLNNIGFAYERLGQYAKALNFYQQALVVRRQIEDRSGKSATLENIGHLLESQKQPELAIVFLKQSVSTYESIREDLRKLPKEQQQSYTDTVASTYRRLANLLLKQDRVLEAQQVLDLLKVQELDDYLRNVRGNARTAQGVDLLPTQQQIWDEYDAYLSKVVKLGKELSALREIGKTRALTAAEDQRRIGLEKEERVAQAEFSTYLQTERVQTRVQQLSRLTGGKALNPEQLEILQDNLKELNNAVVLYPIIFDDRLELVLAMPYAPPIRRPVPVKREELNQAIVDFRRALTDPRLDAKAPAQKLYNWLIKPLEEPLKQANTKTLLYAPDGQLRYIPLAALYDGKQWLTQRFAINNITALSLTDLGKSARPLKVLAAAYTEKGKPYSFQVGKTPFSFTGLRFAGVEVKNLVSLIPNTTQVLDDAFNLTNILNQMTNYSVIHLATHAEFINGQPEQSFILLGNGDRVRFRDLENPDRGIESWRLPNTDLVVLSACKTGVGEELGDGREILGFGYLIQKSLARASISSLWSVNDGGTQALMDAFYANLKQGNLSKVEALQQAQIALITSKEKGTGRDRAGLRIPASVQLPQQVQDNLNHPFYWAPFILIGNGL